MRGTGVTRGLVYAVREGVATFLGIVGVVAIVVGLLYFVPYGSLPNMIHGPVTATGHDDLPRAIACLAGGAACAGVAWLIRVRHRA